MENVVLDLIGGVCSIAQSVVDALDAKDIYIIIGNPIKLTLGLICLTFDIIFIFQYFYYKTQGLEDIEPLLVQDTVINQEDLESK